MSKKDISIIIPIYNAEKKLTRCLDSIINQTFSNWKCILVDDGSTDLSGDICKKYVAKDKRFHVIHKENGGVSSARNVGINESSGEYICFIDSDDYVEKDYLASLLSEEEADIVLCGFKSSSDILVLPEQNYFKLEELSTKLPVLLHSRLLDTPWAKLFKTALIKKNNICFDLKMRLGEDTIFVRNYLCYCKTVKIVNSNFYYYDGIWGGGNRYALSLEEFKHKVKKEYESIMALENRFKCDLNSKRFYANEINLKNLGKCYDTVMWDIFNYLHPEWTLSSFLKEILPHSINIQFGLLRKYIKRKEKKEFYLRLRELNAVYKYSSKEIYFKKKSDKIIYFFIQKKKYKMIYYFIFYMSKFSSLKKRLK